MTLIDSSPIPILLTSSVYVSTSLVQVIDPKMRANLVLDSIIHWTRVAPNSKIIICDGSGYNFSPEISRKYPELDIECLSFENDKQAVMQHGKGYGEGEIIEYALNHSRTLKVCKVFAKCTGKLWVENFNQIAQHFDGNFQCQLSVENPLSIRNIKPSFVDTRFYIANKKFYFKYLLKSHLNVRDLEGYFLEHSFKDAFISSFENISPFLFWTPPLLRGVSGTSGEIYELENLKKRWVTNRLKSVMLKMHEKSYGIK